MKAVVHKLKIIIIIIIIIIYPFVYMAECQVDGWLRDFAEVMATGTQSEIWLATEVHAVLS